MNFKNALLMISIKKYNGTPQEIKKTDNSVFLFNHTDLTQGDRSEVQKPTAGNLFPNVKQILRYFTSFLKARFYNLSFVVLSVLSLL